MFFLYFEHKDNKVFMLPCHALPYPALRCSDVIGARSCLRQHHTPRTIGAERWGCGVSIEP